MLQSYEEKLKYGKKSHQSYKNILKVGLKSYQDAILPLKIGENVGQKSYFRVFLPPYIYNKVASDSGKSRKFHDFSTGAKSKS